MSRRSKGFVERVYVATNTLAQIRNFCYNDMLTQSAARHATAPPLAAKQSPPVPRQMAQGSCRSACWSFPQRVRIEMNDGNSDFGNVTAFDGTVCSVTVASGPLVVKRADIKTLELP